MSNNNLTAGLTAGYSGFGVPAAASQFPHNRLGLIDDGSLAQALSFDTSSSTDGPITAATTQTQAGGYTLDMCFNHVAVGGANDTVTLPKATPGRAIFIVTSTGANTRIFPALGDAITSHGANGSITVATAQLLTLICIARGTWQGGLTAVS